MDNGYKCRELENSIELGGRFIEIEIFLEVLRLHIKNAIYYDLGDSRNLKERKFCSVNKFTRIFYQFEMLKELDFENPDSDVLLLKYHFQDSILRRKSRIRIKF